MHISSLEIQNFKAIRSLTMDNLGDVVVIAGPNGSGKSCILDAIRLLKSFYSSYRLDNEWQHFFSEFQLDINDPEDIKRLFNNREKSIIIRAVFSLADTEKEYIRQNARNKLYQTMWRQRTSHNAQDFIGISEGDTQVNSYTSTSTSADRIATEILSNIDAVPLVGSLTIKPTPEFSITPNPVLQFVFSVSDPHHIGMIDYHSANRAYVRERVGGINVNIEQTEERMAQHALYNWQNKYTTIKSELAGAYVRDILIEKAHTEAGLLFKTRTSIIQTLDELFKAFLPGKEFGGPQPGTSGQLTFPVRLADGSVHDIDDLSSGEKELVYGYLRLRNSAPSNSILLLDEPELHLNPRLVLGLPNFYKRHIGADLNNQLWMVTHSDAFLRDAFKSGGFTLFHLNPPARDGSGKNQATLISADDEVNRAVIELVGDVAGFRPGNKLVIFESSANASFDAEMTKRLFPDFSDRINSLSGDNKLGVKQLYAAIEKAVNQIGLPYKVYAIHDRDSDKISINAPPNTKVFSWDVYHIENYLLHEEYISKVVSDTPSFALRMTPEEVSRELVICAEESMRGLVSHQLRSHIYGAIRGRLDLGYDPQIADPALGLAQASARVATSISKLVSDELGQRDLNAMKVSIEDKLKAALSNNSWRSEFRGRDILRLFAGRRLKGLPYEAFRDSIIARMSDAGFQPPGMAAVVRHISND
jgi:predicted ATPase